MKRISCLSTPSRICMSKSKHVCNQSK